MAAGTRERGVNSDKEGSSQNSTRKPPYKVKQGVQVKPNWCFICLVKLSSSDYPLTSCIDQAGLELSAIPPASVSRVLELLMCTTLEATLKR